MPLNSIGRIILLPWEQEVECSNHSAPTIEINQKAKYLQGVWLFCLVLIFRSGGGLWWRFCSRRWKIDPPSPSWRSFENHQLNASRSRWWPRICVRGSRRWFSCSPFCYRPGRWPQNAGVRDNELADRCPLFC